MEVGNRGKMRVFLVVPIIKIKEKTSGFNFNNIFSVT